MEVELERVGVNPDEAGLTCYKTSCVQSDVRDAVQHPRASVIGPDANAQPWRHCALRRHGLLLCRVEHAQVAAWLQCGRGEWPEDLQRRRQANHIRQVQVAALLRRPASLAKNI
eukprot:55039-Pleurochrysis_carterae.AAC.1